MQTGQSPPHGGTAGRGRRLPELGSFWPASHLPRVSPRSAARAAATRAMGTRKGEHDT